MWNYDNCFFTCPVCRYPGPLMKPAAANCASKRKGMQSSSDEPEDDPDKIIHANDTVNIDAHIAAAAPTELPIFENDKLKNEKR